MKISVKLGYVQLILLLFVLCLGSSAVLSQSDDTAALVAKGKTLIDTQKFTEALPVYEELVKRLPNDAESQKNLGFSLLGKAANTEDAPLREQLRIRAREAFSKAKELGDKSLLIQGMLDGLPVDGRDAEGFSDNAEANKAMKKAEASFSSGDMEGALRSYQEALALDPRCYYAALFSGDVYTQTNKYDDAEKWYQRAISIDPYIETAYRYSATPLMKQNKHAQARDRYIEAFIVDPYSRLALSGIVQWGQVTGTRLGHPKIDVPETKVGPDGKANTTINVNPLSDDGSMAWIAYSATRETWKKEKFARMFPNEKTYRHTMAEEADALRSVVSTAKTLKAKNLNSQIVILEKMDKDGVLEAFVLMAIPDQGIAKDHAAYLRANRDKLRQYVVQYVIEKK